MPPAVKPSQDLTYEQKQELTREDWISIDEKCRKEIHRGFRDLNPKEIEGLIRAAALAHDKAYPNDSLSGLSVTVPAKLLRPIEQAITAVRKMPLKTKDIPDPVD